MVEDETEEFSPMRGELFISGTWRPAADGATFPVDDPATGERLAQVSSATPEDVVEAVAAAHDALPKWSAMPPRFRAETLRRMFQLMEERRAELAQLIVREGGKAWADADSEVTYAAEFFRWYAEEAVRAIGTNSKAPGGDKRIVAVMQPIGVAILVTPWNFPAAMVTRKIAPALAAGCTVVLKPASETPLTALILTEMLQEAGVPEGVVNVVPTQRPAETVAEMLADPRTRALSFTGSTEVGRALLRRAADRVLRCSMELGGNAPFIVFADADIDEAVDGAMVAKMRNGGESCIAANRFYIEQSVAEEFAELLGARMAELTLGSGLAKGTAVGPLINVEACKGVHSLVQGAVEDGARVVVGGRPAERGPCFYEPTVLADVNPDSKILSQEIFGPVAPIVPFDTETDVVAWANDSIFGLAGYVYTSDMARGMRVAEALEVGMVGLNRGLLSDPAAPFGGVKQSGLGREGGHDGLLEFLETKYIAVDW